MNETVILKDNNIDNNVNGAIKKEISLDQEKIIDKKRRFKINLIQLFVGLILIFFSYRYLQENEAERASLMKGFEMIYQKIEIMTKGIISGEAKSLETKYAMIKSFEELLSSYSQSSCHNSTTISNIKEKIDELKFIDINVFNSKIGIYKNYLSKYYTEYVDNCE